MVQARRNTTVTGTRKQRTRCVSILTLCLALLFGFASATVFIVVLISCQTPALAYLHILRLQDDNTSDQSLFGYFGVCTIRDGNTDCYSTYSTTFGDTTTPFLQLTAIGAENRLQPLFTFLLPAAAIVAWLSTMSMILYRLGPAFLPRTFASKVLAHKRFVMCSTLITTWTSFLLTWMAAVTVQQVTQTLAVVAASHFTQSSELSFTQGSLGVALHWLLAGLITIFAFLVSINLLYSRRPRPRPRSSSSGVHKDDNLTRRPPRLRSDEHHHNNNLNLNHNHSHNPNYSYNPNYYNNQHERHTYAHTIVTQRAPTVEFFHELDGSNKLYGYGNATVVERPHTRKTDISWI